MFKMHQKIRRPQNKDWKRRTYLVKDVVVIDPIHWKQIVDDGDREKPEALLVVRRIGRRENDNGKEMKHMPKK